MSYYATPRMTRDIDLVVALRGEDAPRIHAAFDDDDYVPDNLPQAVAGNGMFNLVHFVSVVKVDVIVRKDDPFLRHEFGRRRRVDLGGFHIWIASREDLILSKLKWMLDTDSEQQRRDILALLPGADAGYLALGAAARRRRSARTSVVNDTAPEVAERLRIATRMFDTARVFALAALPGSATAEERRGHLLHRFYPELVDHVAL